ncbi:MAG: DUF4037 domain-containing protein [Clostridiales bacterium]|nr:DUF4037 domain-containing protein [Clostridiales bacterium]
MKNVIDKNRRFYENRVKELIRSRFPEYEDRIAVGIAGEGSDCFGYDDEISRDHDFGTGVCLWITDEDMELFGRRLSAAYNELVDSEERAYFTDRLRERRGVMTIRAFYSNILNIDCDAESGVLTDEQWYRLDHSCLKTAVNGEVFRDDLGVFTAFRRYLSGYYPDRVWRTRIAEQLHEYASSFQVNYARCMTRGDTVAAELCRARGMSSAMELFFLLKREYPPYYKWTYRALTELDAEGSISAKLLELSQERIRPEAWEGTRYHPNRQNYKDRIVSLSEEIASELELMLVEKGLSRARGRYLEAHVSAILAGISQ